jgi:hypothetical protein
MAEQTQEKRAKIPLTRFLADYKSGVPDREVMQTYGLSARNLISLIKTLMEKGILSPEDLTKRKQMTEQIELVKEKQFLKGLFICPKCGHPHPQQFEVCPACEAKLDDYVAPERVVQDVTTTGGHFYVDDTTTIEEQPENPEDSTEPIRRDDSNLEAPTELLTSPQTESGADVSSSPTSVAADKGQPDKISTQKAAAKKPEPDNKPAAATEEQPKEKSSPFKSVRALISRIRKS